MKDMQKEIGQLLVSNEEFNQLLTRQVKLDEEYVNKEPIKGFFPQLFVYDARKSEGHDRDFIIIPLAANEEDFDEEKHKIMFKAGVMMAMEQPEFLPVAIFMTSEAWTKEVESKEEVEKIEQAGQGIAGHADKVETLITAGLTIDQRSNLSQRKITRGRDNTIFLSGKPLFMLFEGVNNIQPLLLQRFFQGYAVAVKKRQETT